jgi:hypothetical protein
MEEERRHFHSNNRNRDRDRGGRNPRRMSHGGKSGRSQRPLLTSSINAAGLCLVALVVSLGFESSFLGSLGQILAWAVIAFSISALISYFAQRSSKKWVEKSSDLFFLVGVLLIIYVAWLLAGFN